MRSLLLLVLVLAALEVAPANAQRNVVCYYSSWAVYRPGNGHFGVEDIDPFLCTHAMYAFIGLETDGRVTIMDPWNDIELGGYQRFNDLRLINPSLKTLVSIGGWNVNSSIFSEVARNPPVRAAFVENLFAFVTQYGFNGLDLDWEYPGQRGGIPEDKANYVLLLQELRGRFSPAGLLLTAAVGAQMDALDISYDVQQLGNNLDLILLMTYDYHGSWEDVTGMVSPLYAAANDVDQGLNAHSTVQLWLQRGAPFNKLVLGIPTYGRSFTLENPANFWVGAPITGPGAEGPYTLSQGFLGYHEVCEMQMQGGYTEVWHAEQEVPFMYRDNFWIGYENAMSARLKADYVNRYQLAGAMIWSLDTDDFRNVCGGGRYPLLNAVRSAFK